jgi:RimJ/RimL family protein N-acetyltransferase
MIEEAAISQRQGQANSRSMAGRRVKLVPVTSRYVEFLYNLSVDEEIAYRWRYHGRVPSLDRFAADLWKGVLAQFVVVSAKSGSPLGLVVAYDFNLRNGYAYLGGVMTPHTHRTGAPIEAFRIFLAHIFRNWNLHKLYMEYPEYNMPQFFARRPGLGVVPEARLTDHIYYGGKWWDWITVALYRTEFFAFQELTEPGGTRLAALKSLATSLTVPESH